MALEKHLGEVNYHLCYAILHSILVGPSHAQSYCLKSNFTYECFTHHNSEIKMETLAQTDASHPSPAEMSIFIFLIKSCRGSWLKKMLC